MLQKSHEKPNSIINKKQQIVYAFFLYLQLCKNVAETVSFSFVMDKFSVMKENS